MLNTDLSACKDKLCLIRALSESKVADFIDLLKDIANIDKTLQPTDYNYKIAALFLLAEVYLEIVLKAKQQSKINPQTKAYLSAQQCLTDAEKMLKDNEGKLNLELIAGFNSRRLADPDVAKSQLATALLDDLILASEGQASHRISQGN